MEKQSVKQKVDSFSKFLWDSDSGKILGRGGRSWAEICFFYLIYYACLASFFAATLAVFYETIDDDVPKLLSDSSLLNGNPGLGFRPMADLDDPKITSVSALGKNKKYKDNLDEFLKKYKGTLDTTSCDGITTTRKGSVACAVSYAALTKTCGPHNDYGFADGSPCVLLKLNKVYGWEPKLWDTKEDGKLHKSIDYDSSVVPLRCYAKDKDDQDKIGTLQYHPQQGFPVHYFPYRKQKDYRSPLVFVQFSNATKGSTYEIECRAYAKNIEYDRTEMQGSTQFKIKIK